MLQLGDVTRINGAEIESVGYMIDTSNYTHDKWENDWYTCPNCGYDCIDIGHNYCPGCGVPVAFGDEEEDHEAD